MTTFNELGLAETVLRALRKEDYETPTPIQMQAIPILMKGHDLLGIAQTGTGKTAAFATPLISRMLEDPRRAIPRHVRVLVLAPTRELAAQISDSFRAYGRFANLRVATVVGGVSHGPQIKNLHMGLDVLVATPGRLLDHMDAGHEKLDKVEAVVLDEADHMFDLGFIVPIRKIMAKLPKVRQSLFFSATMPREISALAGEFLHNPQRVEVAPVATTAERVRQEAIMVSQAGKLKVLSGLIAKPDCERTIVFTRTKRGADRVCKHLDDTGVRSVAIHGNKSQGQRVAALDAFKSGRATVMVATDLAARGIDVSGVSHVVNFELPEVAESYVHRIGRTARAGAEGVAISLVAGAEEMGYLRDIEKLIRITLPREDRRTPGSRDAAPAPAQRPAQHRGGGRSTPRAHGARTQDSRGHESRANESRGHESRGQEAAPGSKGPRRPRRGGGNNAAPQPNRHEQPRPAQQGGKSQAGQTEGIQGVAFLHRASRPNTQPNRTNRPQR